MKQYFIEVEMPNRYDDMAVLLTKNPLLIEREDDLLSIWVKSAYDSFVCYQRFQKTDGVFKAHWKSGRRSWQPDYEMRRVKNKKWWMEKYFDIYLMEELL